MKTVEQKRDFLQSQGWNNAGRLARSAWLDPEARRLRAAGWYLDRGYGWRRGDSRPPLSRAEALAVLKQEGTKS